jgi:hypothetical protein
MEPLILFIKARKPTPAMLAAGNYKKKRTKWRGLDITIETPKGKTRSGVDGNGKAWSVVMRHDYGYIRRTKGADDEQIDCYIGPYRDAEYVYVIHQRKAGDWINYDEDKVMLDFPSKRDALIAYLAHYDDPRFYGEISVIPADEFSRQVLKTSKLPIEERRLRSDISNHLGV